MSIFKRKQKSVEVNKILDFLGLHNTNEDVLSEATYFACLKILSESIAKLPLKLQRNTADGGVVAMNEEPLYNILKNRPNPYMTASTFWGTVENNRNHHGNAYCLITGFPDNIGLWILESEHIEVWYDNAMLLSDAPNLWYVFTHPKSGKTYKFNNSEILHFKTSSSFDGVLGKSIRTQLASTVKSGTKSQNMMNKLYDSNFTAKMVVQYTGNLNDDNVKSFTKGIENYALGKDADVKSIIPIPLGATITPLNIKLTDAQFIELKRYTALQIAAAFGIKPNQINDYTKSSYANSEAQQLAFYIDTLLYPLKQYEEEINYKLLTTEQIQRGYHVKFNVAVTLRANLKEQMESLAHAVANGVYTPNEARGYLDLPTKTGGDKLYFNGSNMPIELAGQQYMKGNDK